ARVAALTGAPGDVAELVELARLPPDAEVLGPVPIARPGEPPGARVLVRVPWRRGRDLAQALRAAAGVRAAARAGGPVRVEVDPRELG
ncbi:MAG: primosome assembly protein PriA, partial [Actinomycetota bacterium]